LKYLRTLFLGLFVLYIPALICITFIFPPRERNAKTYQYHFIPLESTLAQIHDPAQYNTPDFWQMFAISVTGNFLLFLPLGFFLKYFGTLSNRRVFLTAMIISIAIETMQLVFHAGVCDIDDVLLNSFGAVAGIWLCVLFKRNFNKAH
jgi:glycopeptide antibiotics resistance protein